MSEILHLYLHDYLSKTFSILSFCILSLFTGWNSMSLVLCNRNWNLNEKLTWPAGYITKISFPHCAHNWKEQQRCVSAVATGAHHTGLMMKAGSMQRRQINLKRALHSLNSRVRFFFFKGLSFCLWQPPQAGCVTTTHTYEWLKETTVFEQQMHLQE